MNNKTKEKAAERERERERECWYIGHLLLSQHWTPIEYFRLE